MGMFDKVYIDKKILEKYNMGCPKCGQFPEDFQTKDLICVMNSYHLVMDPDGQIRLFKLDEPTDKKWWHEYTDEEIKENNEGISGSTFSKILLKEKGDGYWEDEAWLPENRYHRHMGQFPHQWISVYTSCQSCRLKYPEGWIEFAIKFTDGLVCEVKKVEPENGLY